MTPDSPPFIAATPSHDGVNLTLSPSAAQGLELALCDALRGDDLTRVQRRTITGILDRLRAGMHDAAGGAP